MASKVSNPPSTIVTRRKKRDLEATMKSLKKLLEPSSRSRKKNIPRSISKKLTPKKSRSINRFESYENSSEDGEFYPDKLKRKDNTKKIVLKPRHELKVVIATNKRKRGMPHRGFKSVEEKLTILNKTSTEQEPKLLNQSQDLKSEFSRHYLELKEPPLSVNTYTNTMTRYELISPPHRSLTELTVDDLMRMDEDSLSDDDLMEVLTCPSPVWWEEPPDYFNEDILYLVKTGDTELRNVIEKFADRTSIVNPISNSIESKRTKIVCETKKSKKMAKLENILGNIKNRVKNKAVNVTNNKSNDEIIANDKVNAKSNVNNMTYDDYGNDTSKKITSEANQHKTNEKDGDNPEHASDETKPRKISSSGSDISINDEDLLRNLENIDIPILNVDTEDIQSDINGEKQVTSKHNSEDKVGKVISSRIDLKIQNTGKRAIIEAGTNKKNLTKNAKIKIITKQSTEDLDPSKHIAESEKHKEILKRLNKPTNDILDVRLIQIPTNVTNEVKIWSKLDNFKRHNLTPEDFNVIDIENELAFSMIKSDQLKIDPETICIDDDDDDQIKEVIDLDVIGKTNDKIDTDFTEMAELIPVNAEKNITREDTIPISKDLDVRLIETPVSINQISKRTQKIQINAKKLEATKPSKPKKKNESNKEIRGIRILPMNMLAKVSNSQTNKIIKTKTKKLIKQYAKDKTNLKIKGIKVINAQNDKVIRINDLDISLVKVNDQNIESNRMPEVKNDLCITLVKSDKTSDKCKEINKPTELLSKTPVILPPLTKIVRSDKTKEVNQKSVSTPVTLPSLIKNPNHKLESPKSINSISSETTDISEGVISDTNIQFLDEYDEDKRSVDIILEDVTIDIENTDNANSSRENIKSFNEICINKEVEDNNPENISDSNVKS